MFQENIALAKCGSYKIGGPARYFYEAQSVSAVERAIAKAKRKNLQIFILGGGTNLIFSDQGFPGLVLKPNLKKITSDDVSLVRAEAGVLMSDLLDFAARRGLAGLEWAGGLPGTLGGAIRGNAGAFGGEIKDLVREVSSIRINGPKTELIRRGNADCRFGYRASIFKEHDGEEIILAAALQLKRGDKHEIRAALEEKIQYRLSHHPMEYPNIGSIFKNIDARKVSKKTLKQFQNCLKNDPFPVLPTAALIASAGLKGVSLGGAMVSPKHPNFIVNVLNATAEDVKKLAELVQSIVKSEFGVVLEKEVISVGA